MDLPMLSKEQTIKHLNKGNNLLAFNIHDGTKRLFNNKNQKITIREIQQSSKVIYYLYCPKTYNKYKREAQIRDIKHFFGIIPLLLSSGFFMAFFNHSKLKYINSEYAPLIIALALSYIGCHFLVKIMNNFKTDQEEFRKLFLLD
jgi:hypothetical protein